VYRDQTRCTFSFDRPEAMMSLAQWPGPAALCPSAGEVTIFKGFFGSMTSIPHGRPIVLPLTYLLLGNLLPRTYKM
jgi:hypothetical protein